ncbi:MAG: hypothetical protein ACN4GW_03620 [Desulforhopalus sp.]
MTKTTRQKLLMCLTGTVISFLLFISSGMRISAIDDSADAYFNTSITKAGVSYGVCRIVNGTVSVIKESHLELEPAGIGLSLAVGQVVDPINDMVERLSNVLVLSITSLGVQELAYEICLTVAPPILAVTLLLLSILVWQEGGRTAKLRGVVMTLALIITIARFCLPFSALVNDYLHKNFFEDKINEANHALSKGIADLDSLKDVSLPKYGGIFETIENSATYLKKRSVDFKNAIAATIENRELIVKNLLKLTFLYGAIFIIQVLLLPLLIFWLLVKIMNVLLFSATFSSVTKSVETE